MNLVDTQVEFCDMDHGENHAHTDCCEEKGSHNANSSTDSKNNHRLPCACHCSMSISMFSLETWIQDFNLLHSFQFKNENIALDDSGYSKGYTSIWQPPKIA